MAESENNSSRKFTPAFDLFSISSKMVQRNLKVFLILYSLTIATTLFSMFSAPEDKGPVGADLGGVWGNNLGVVIGTGIFLGLLFAIVSFIIQILLYVLQLRAAKDETPSIGELWQTASKFAWRLLGLLIIVGLTVFAGFLLFIVPGLIFLRRYFLSPYYLIDQNLSISEAMKKSADESKPVSGAVWGIIGVSVLISLVSVIPFIGPLISLVLGLLYSVAPAIRYYELKNGALAKASS